nr:hypothetical protein CFP56_03874 [Quercus suber]
MASMRPVGRVWDPVAGPSNARSLYLLDLTLSTLSPISLGKIAGRPCVDILHRPIWRETERKTEEEERRGTGDGPGVTRWTVGGIMAGVEHRGRMSASASTSTVH